MIPNIWYTSKDKKHKAVRSHLNIPILKQMDIITLHLRSLRFDIHHRLHDYKEIPVDHTGGADNQQL